MATLTKQNKSRKSPLKSKTKPPKRWNKHKLQHKAKRVPNNNQSKSLALLKKNKSKKSKRKQLDSL